MRFINLSASFLIILFVLANVSAQKMKPEEIVAKHLEAIGSAEARTAVKSMLAVGNVKVTFVSQKNQSAEGRVVIASTGGKMFLGMNLNAADYPLEKFSYDGNKSKVAYVRSNVRSILGNFLMSNNLLLEESLLGGTLFTSWSLANLADKKAKLSSEGTKKINGKEAFAISYSRKSGGDIDITMYFDKENFRHVRTEYKRTSSAAIGRTIDESARQNETRLKITEDFSDFKTETGLNLPHAYVLNYSISGQNGTNEIEWKFAMTEFAVNQKLDEKTFDAEAE